MKRKLSDLSESQNDSTQDDNTANHESLTNINYKTYLDEYDDFDDAIIAMTFREKLIVFDIPTSFKLENLKEKIGKEFNLDPATYRLEYEDIDV